MIYNHLQFKYTKDHRENDVGRVTSVTERPDIQHAVSRKDIISDVSSSTSYETRKVYNFFNSMNIHVNIEIKYQKVTLLHQMHHQFSTLVK